MAKSIDLPVTGMSCAACAVSVESTLSHMEGVRSASVNYASHSAQSILDKEEVEIAGAAMALSSVSVVTSSLRLNYIR
ncbi:MAG TPA: heavy metal-associated domain-containing protein [Lunatimonas sp.]|nr:heavy metal-associated domain-containing protein [Lunatimonas sp.]